MDTAWKGSKYLKTLRVPSRITPKPMQSFLRGLALTSSLALTFTSPLLPNPSHGSTPPEKKSLPNASKPTLIATSDTSQASAVAQNQTLLDANTFKGEDEHNFYWQADQYFQELFVFEPSLATGLGVHEFDSLLEDVSAAGRSKEDRFNESWLRKLEAIDKSKLSLEARDDLELLLNHVKLSLFESKERENWKLNPDIYSSFVGSTLFPLIKRDFAPLDERLKAVIAREKQMPKFLADGEKNIDPKSVPKIFAQIASEQLPGIIDFFKKDVPEAVKDAKSPLLKAEFRESNDKVVVALASFQKFVRGILADKSYCQGNFALGKERFQRLLSLSEMIDEPLDSLESRGTDELKRLQQEFKQIASDIDPKKEPKMLFSSISENHPSANNLLLSVKDLLASIRTFIVKNDIVTIPGSDNLIVEDSPPFMKAIVFAAMDAPGPFEKKAKEAFYFVTMPDKSWDAKHIEEHMRFYSYPDLLNTSVHEAYPGHYVQSLWQKNLNTNIRKIMMSSSNEEGWAHYCEQMMLDQGFKSGSKELRLIQIHDALLRCCRYLVAIKMHTQKMTVDEATNFFMNEGYQEKANAEREAKRGTVDPTYLVYTYGKLEILSLRDQVKKSQGQNFDLKRFHDTYLSIGAPPLKIVRLELLSKLAIAGN